MLRNDGGRRHDLVVHGAGLHASAT
jgi:hypothetical protein